MVKFRTCLVAALLIAAPASLAVAAPGLVRAAATLRAGPGSGFPVVDRIPAGARVTIHGCIEGGAWCDVSFERERGWVAAKVLAYLSGQRYVYLTEYVEEVPIVPFTLTTYWSSFYIGRPW
ncbi:MAG: SH3 domain-containing protein, partial [Bradyrhizobium sp.]